MVAIFVLEDNLCIKQRQAYGNFFYLGQKYTHKAKSLPLVFVSHDPLAIDFTRYNPRAAYNRGKNSVNDAVAELIPASGGSIWSMNLGEMLPMLLLVGHARSNLTFAFERACMIPYTVSILIRRD